MSTLDSVQLEALALQSQKLHDHDHQDHEHSHKYPQKYPPETSRNTIPDAPGAMVLLYGFVSVEDIRDADEQAEVLSNVHDLMSPFGGVESGIIQPLRPQQ